MHAAQVAAFQSHHQAHMRTTIGQLATAPSRTASTIPPNGDLNPYGVAFVPNGFPRGGMLRPGDVLVSNFNNSANLQGTGTTIVRVSPNAAPSVFFQAPSTGFGLSTALGVLKSGFVLVGSVPSTDGTSATVGQGSLLVIDKNGNMVANLTDANLLNGPWDLTIHDAGNRGQIFVSNVLSGTVSRLDFSVRHGQFQIRSAVQIASGYTHGPDPAAFELGPTGLAFDSKSNTLYVASTADNAIYVIHNAASLKSDHGTGTVLFADQTHLHGPLGLTFAPDGNLITANGDAVNADPNNSSTLVEFTRNGKFVGQFSLSSEPGGAFGVASASARFAAVNDITNAVTIWAIRS